MELWTVYKRPASGCEVRKILVEDEGLVPADTQLFRNLGEARLALSRRGLIRVPRDPQDDPALLETWL